MSDRDLILDSLPQDTTPGESFDFDFAEIAHHLWDVFESSLALLGGKLIDERQFEELKLRSHWADPILGFSSTARDIWEAEVGFSFALGAIAQSGTLIVQSSSSTYRLSSLIPPLNVVVVDRESIFPTLKEALPQFPASNLAMVTGPSRTADIEGILVRGIHGPGDLLVYVRDRP